jgi:hypothetical protein
MNEKQVLETPNGHNYTQKEDEEGIHVFFEDFPNIWVLKTSNRFVVVPQDLDEIYEKLQQRRDSCKDSGNFGRTRSDNASSFLCYSLCSSYNRKKERKHEKGFLRPSTRLYEASVSEQERYT